MNTNKIREALTYGIGLAYSMQVKTGNSHSLVIDKIKAAIAELDRMEAPKVLTDEEIMSKARSFGETRNLAGSDMALESMSAWEMGARHTRDSGYLAPAAGLTVESAVDVAMHEVGQWLAETNKPFRNTPDEEAQARLRVRLTAAFRAKSQPQKRT